MEAAFALLLPLIAGYLYVSHCKQLKYKQSRDDGHRLYFRIAYFGVLLFIFAGFLFGLLHWLFGDYPAIAELHGAAVDIVKPLLKEPDNASSQIAFMLICILTMAMGRLLPYVDNWLFSGKAENALLEAASESDLEMLLLEAALQFKTISVSTASNKVYVGIVLQTPEPRTDRLVIALLPYMSGYRTETGRVVFTTFYDEIYAKRAEERDDEESNDFRLILPIDKMLSVSFFDVETYAAFNAKEVIAAPRRVKVHTSTGRRPRAS